jgi:hypothetical protein
MTIDDRMIEAWRSMQARNRFSPEGDLPGDGGGGTSGGVTDDWKASVDRQLERLHSDVRDLLRGLIGVAIFVLALIGGLYLYIGSKSDAVVSRTETIEGRTTRIETKQDAIDQRLDRIEQKIDQLSDRASRK